MNQIFNQRYVHRNKVNQCSIVRFLFLFQLQSCRHYAIYRHHFRNHNWIVDLIKKKFLSIRFHFISVQLNWIEGQENRKEMKNARCYRVLLEFALHISIFGISDSYKTTINQNTIIQPHARPKHIVISDKKI